MRVIAGTYRSRRLVAPEGLETRPTSDRLRETLFNILAPRMAGAVFADLYAGSGANGIEAISRGAKLVYFVENAVAAMEAVKGNLRALGVVSGYGLEFRGVSAFLRRLAGKENALLDLVVLDPPYASAEEYSGTLGLLGGECSAVLAAGAVVVAEHRKKDGLAEEYGRLRRFRVVEKGDAGLSFFAVEGN